MIVVLYLKKQKQQQQRTFSSIQNVIDCVPYDINVRVLRASFGAWGLSRWLMEWQLRRDDYTIVTVKFRPEYRPILT